jgi:hypothetical protein
MTETFKVTEKESGSRWVEYSFKLNVTISFTEFVCEIVGFKEGLKNTVSCVNKLLPAVRLSPGSPLV